MSKICEVKKTLMNYICAQIDNIYAVDYEELGAAIDMVKDLCEAEYYCTITAAMDADSEVTNSVYYYTEAPLENSKNNKIAANMTARKKTLETKKTNGVKDASLKSLEQCAQELTEEAMDLAQDATPEEKQVFKQKLNMLISKIN